MKKILILAISVIMATALILFHSCSRQEDALEIVDNSSAESQQLVYFDELEADLLDYSQTFISEVETRSGFFRGLGRIVMADALGALVGYGALGPAGGFSGAVVSSLGCFMREMTEVEVSNMVYEDFFDSSTSLYKEVSEVDAFNHIGLAHNELIGKILENNTGIESLSQSELVELIEASAEEFGYDFTYIPNETLDYIFSLSDHQSSDSMISDVELTFPALQGELDILKIYSETLPKVKEEQVSNFNVGFKETVEHSKIRSDSKNMIITSISVAENSAVLWNQEVL